MTKETTKSNREYRVLMLGIKGAGRPSIPQLARCTQYVHGEIVVNMPQIQIMIDDRLQTLLMKFIDR